MQQQKKVLVLEKEKRLQGNLQEEKKLEGDAKLPISHFLKIE